MATGQKVIEKMNPEEKQFFEEKIQKIELGDSYETVKEILGIPDRGDGTARPTWKVLETKGRNQVAIYLSERGTVSKVRWMNIGKFVWEK
jgi:hypothetical protein